MMKEEMIAKPPQPKRSYEMDTPLEVVPAQPSELTQRALASLHVGLKIATRYLLLNRIAIGGMGEVWRAYDEKEKREVALKILRPELAGQKLFLSRLRIESRNARQVHHPNLAEVLDSGEENGLGWIVMEMVRGKSLTQILDEQVTLKVSFLLSVLQQTSMALAAVHRNGIVHRDIKPGNIMVTDEGRVKLTDFGISKAVNQITLTAQGMVMGTAQYLPPEQAIGKLATPAGDLYALGIIAYEALAGKRPFTGEKPVDIAFEHVNSPVPPLPEQVPGPLQELVMALLEKDPAKRINSAEVLNLRIEQVRDRLLDSQIATPEQEPPRVVSNVDPETMTSIVLNEQVIAEKQAGLNSEGETKPAPAPETTREAAHETTREAIQEESQKAAPETAQVVAETGDNPQLSGAVAAGEDTAENSAEAAAALGENRASGLAEAALENARGVEKQAGLDNAAGGENHAGVANNAVGELAAGLAENQPLSAQGERPATEEAELETEAKYFEEDGSPLRYLAGGTVPAPEAMPAVVVPDADKLAGRRQEQQTRRQNRYKLLAPLSMAHNLKAIQAGFSRNLAKNTPKLEESLAGAAPQRSFKEIIFATDAEENAAAAAGKGLDFKSLQALKAGFKAGKARLASLTGAEAESAQVEADSTQAEADPAQAEAESVQVEADRAQAEVELVQVEAESKRMPADGKAESAQVDARMDSAGADLNQIPTDRKAEQAHSDTRSELTPAERKASPAPAAAMVDPAPAKANLPDKVNLPDTVNPPAKANPLSSRETTPAAPAASPFRTPPVIKAESSDFDKQLAEAMQEQPPGSPLEKTWWEARMRSPRHHRGRLIWPLLWARPLWAAVAFVVILSLLWILTALVGQGTAQSLMPLKEKSSLPAYSAQLSPALAATAPLTPTQSARPELLSQQAKIPADQANQRQALELFPGAEYSFKSTSDRI